MRDVTVNGKVVRLYESIDEMPIVNYQKYNKYVLLDSNLGSDIESVDEHIIRIAKYISKDDKANAMQELQNMRQNMHMVVNDISPNSMAFAALIYSIDGKEQKDLSDTHLREIMEELRDMPYGVFTEMLAWVKKKTLYRIRALLSERVRQREGEGGIHEAENAHGATATGTDDG